MGVCLTVSDISRAGCPLSRRSVKNIIDFLAGYYSLSGKKEVHLTFCDNQYIQEINERYLHKQCPTDVIVFDLSDGLDPLWGDMVISVPMARAQSRQFKTTFRHECALYIIHGFLHLMGYSDKGRKRLAMKKEEEKILALIKKKRLL